jgi:thioesterase domain-containing protein
VSKPASNALARRSLDFGAPYEAAADATEAEIAKLFAEVFGIDFVGATDDFFDLGGDSLLGESLATSISQYWGREFQISLLVSLSTPRKVARHIAEQDSATPPVPRKRPPIFMVHGLRGFVLPRPEFLDGLAPGQTLRMFELPGIRDGREACTRIEDIAAAYVEQIQSEQPNGPILLSSYCGGGVVALEMATQLKEKGRSILHMVLFDPGGIQPNVLDNMHRHRFGENSGIARRMERADAKSWYRRFGRRLRLLPQVGRWTDGSKDEDLTDEKLRRFHERKYMRHMRRQKDNLKRREYAQFNLSDLAQARFLAAFHHYRPRPYDGPVDVFSSEAYRWKFEDSNSIWTELLPQRTVHVLGETHHDVINASGKAGAEFMQQIFDKALAAR